ncbi:Gfo/Idh/MocA family protein [Arthrobacter sp. H14]|uniref:Gfo/Idh/MocA family protein n=1 Tax=Arthrobacter sp. H14 TaxID=1312959 RepID=UPI0004B9FD8E|nr:Gfo/Idh/MocA family oxidoreductase [Arthrobacter sp. H14]
MTEQLRVGIVGCGAIAGNHAEAYLAAEGAVVVGCCDVDTDRATSFAASAGISSAVETVDELLDLGLDVVSVCTPHPTHESVVVAAASRGVHVLCEKPIAVDSASARRMIDACEDAGVVLGVLFQRRFWPAAQRLRAAIDDGTLGDPVLGHCSVLLHREPEYYSADAWRGMWATDGGGVLMTQGIHYIDLLQWFMGPVAEVTGRVGTFKHGEHIEVEDSAVATLLFESGALATVQASTAVTPNLGVQVRVTGRNGASASVSEYPEGEPGANDLWAVPGEAHYAPVYDDGVEPNVPLSQINARLAPFHALQIADFVDAIRSGREPAVTGREALKSLQIVTAVYESAVRGMPVRIGDE